MGSIAQVNIVVAHMDGSHQDHARLVGQAEHAAQTLSLRAQALQQAVGEFNLGTDGAEPKHNARGTQLGLAG